MSIGDGSFSGGTRIAVPGPDGTPAAVPVETLRQGDTVLTLTGPIRLRHATTTTFNPATGGGHSRMLPVHVAAGAFGPGLPQRDLVMPAEQMLYVRDAWLPEGALAPLGALVNQTSIRRERPANVRTWHRLELELQGVVMAEGLAVAARHDPTAPPFAPFLPPGPTIHALRIRLAHAAEALAAPPPAAPAPANPLAAEPAPAPLASEADLPVLRVEADGAAIPPLDASSVTVWHFTIPGNRRYLRLLSPPGVPANTEEARLKDARRFGVAVRAIHVDGTALTLDGPAIGDGFHPVEQAGSQQWRWTSGNATVTLPPGDESRTLTVEITDWHTLLRRV